MILSLVSCGGNTNSATHVERDDWSNEVKEAINALVDTYGVNSDNYGTPYAVFDFDNTCSIFDVEEQLAIYQLQVMAFKIKPDELAEVLYTGIGDHSADRSELGYGKGSYDDWVFDITKAYTYLYNEYGPFTATGLDIEEQKKIQEDDQWLEFATKMRAMYDLVYDAESASVAYPWVLYWFTGMTEDEVYDLASASHNKYKEVETSKETWTSPSSIKSKVGVVTYTWTSGTQVSENIKELWKVLDANGIDVWVCSASGTGPIKAAIDAWGLHDCCTGMIAMTNAKKNEKYVNEYDYKNGCGWLANEDGSWTLDTNPTKAQTQGVGKTEAIANAIAPHYENHGPIAGFMDSTGDFNICTEFNTTKLVVCFNRASRKVTDGGGLISAIALYEADTLGYDFSKADSNGDTLYVLQGRDENGLRGLVNSRGTLLFGESEEKILANEDNESQLKYLSEKKLKVKDAINKFAIKTNSNDKKNVLGFDYGFLEKYDGYHYHK